MNGLEFAAKVIEVVIWPFSLAVATLLVYWNRGKGGSFFGEFFKRLRELNLGSFRVILAESSSPPVLNADIKEARYRRYTNGILVQQLTFGMEVGMKFTFIYPFAFPNEVLSFQFIGSAPLPIKDVTTTGFVLDATGYPGPIHFELKITGL